MSQLARLDGARRCSGRRERAIYVDPPDEAYDDDPEAWFSEAL